MLDRACYFVSGNKMTLALSPKTTHFATSFQTSKGKGTQAITSQTGTSQPGGGPGIPVGVIHGTGVVGFVVVEGKSSWRFIPSGLVAKVGEGAIVVVVIAAVVDPAVEVAQ